MSVLDSLPEQDFPWVKNDPSNWQPWDRVERAASTKWVIEGVLGRGHIGIMYGQPASYKSFIALDMALSVAAGTNWQGRQTDQGTVIYIAAEGGDDVAVRQAAWLTHKQEERNLPFHLESSAPLLSEGISTFRNVLGGIKHRLGFECEAVRDYQRLAFTLGGDKYDELAQEDRLDSGKRATEYIGQVATELKARFESHQPAHPIRLIIIDTYAATSEGDTREHWNRYFRGIKMHMPQDAAVLIIDHTTKDGGTYMGTQGKRGDVDFIAAIKRKGQGRAAMIVKGGAGKVKAAPEFDDIEFAMQAQPVERAGVPTIDAYGNPLTSLVSVPREGAQDDEPAPPTGKAKVLYDLLAEPMEKRAARAEFVRLDVEAGAREETAKRAFTRSLKTLVDNEQVKETAEEKNRILSHTS